MMWYFTFGDILYFETVNTLWRSIFGKIFFLCHLIFGFLLWFIPYILCYITYLMLCNITYFMMIIICGDHILWWSNVWTSHIKSCFHFYFATLHIPWQYYFETFHIWWRYIACNFSYFVIFLLLIILFL